MLQPSPRVIWLWVSKTSYAAIVIITACFLVISYGALFSQAVRTSPRQTWKNNWSVLTTGATYIVVLLISIVLCVKRRITIARKMQRVSKAHTGLNKRDIPKPVHDYIMEEYARSCLITYECQPKNTVHLGWGRLGTKYSGMRFRRTLLDTIADIDNRARLVIPSHPVLKPHARILHHFRFILPLLPKDEDGLTALHYYDSAIQLARISEQELTEEEFETGMRAASDIQQILNECRLEMLEESRTQLNVSPHSGLKKYS
ncbi:hypothetical protein CONPUDRAFT_114994 [Coniophora puteana RWD-64-598 SS2]|uniref:Defect at low temperature protein 1 n=1 Tax=Coniophora puteana (strain RWD-64-598) TaxID=741705 RepID=A0A5M3N589_CONPW|nr:uncharacterized protein CONPUDRAFT_114994 [Coniophora puteana RWD-64-598 SS2]EIW86553.1 hypothetical protein CONPUDRAFT_114994 [Coniophora puteana RWD-64-598 SS2]